MIKSPSMQKHSVHRDLSLQTFLVSEEDNIVRDDTYLDINVNLGDKLMLRVAEQMGLNPKWISCVILAPDQLQDYLPDVKVHMFCSSNSTFC